MQLLSIARMDPTELELLVTHLEDTLPADREMQRELIRERAEELGISAHIEECMRALQVSATLACDHRDMLSWPEPEALAAPPPPAFRTDWLPDIFGEYAQALAEFNQTPPDLSAALMLGAVNAAALGLYEVQAGWVEPFQLFVCVSMNPSERKSPVFSAIRRPIDEWEASENALRAPAIARRKTERTLKESQLKKAMSKGDEAEALRLTDELERIPELNPLCLITADATPEAIALMMRDNGGRIVLMDSEGGIFDTMAGRYANHVANLDVYLHGFSNERVSVSRVGRETLTISCAQMTAVLAVQPDVVKGVFANAAMRGRGLASRFLWVQPPSAIGRRRIEVAPVDKGLERRYSERVIDLLGRSRSGGRVPITLTPDAARAFDQWRAEVERRLTGDLASLVSWGWAGKLCGLTLRIAGTLAVMRNETEISANTILTAVDVSRWAIGHAQAVGFDLNTDAGNVAQKALEKIREKNLRSGFTRRELQKYVERQNAFKTNGRFDGGKLDSALAELETAGYIRKAALTADEDRRRVCRWNVNPRLFKNERMDEEVEEL